MNDGMDDALADAKGTSSSGSPSGNESYHRESLEEYSTDEAVQRYLSASAGSGVAYLLQHLYGPLYDDQIDKIVAEMGRQEGFRILEYGCGGGMNLIWIVRRLLERQINLEFACGTDFSAKMVEAAKTEASSTLPRTARENISFHTVANGNLSRDLPKILGRPLADLRDSFHFILGVNTFRYCFRLGTQAEAANDIFSLLRPGGRSVMIDMNRSFPFFRSRFRNLLTKRGNQVYLPRLDEYATVFREAGFDIEINRNFCWVPHSAGPATVATLRTLSPLLQPMFSRFAMRSLVVARKPL